MMRALAVVAVLLLAGCLQADTEPGPTDDRATPTARSPTGTTPTPPPRTPAPDASEAGDLVDANTRFAIDLFRALSQERPGENLVVSPYSISTALQMLLGGANGTTHRAMAGALRLGDALDTLDPSAAALLANLTTSDPNVTLRIGNSLWVDRAFGPEVDPAFPARIEESYQGELHTRDFADPETVGDINAWASDKTEGKIDKVLDRISPSEILFLMNAVYFKGSWRSEFNESCTHDAPFHTDAGAQVVVDMMCGAPERSHAYTDSPERAIARLPYGDGRFAMYLVLPPEGTPLDAFVGTWDGVVASGSYSTNVVVEMPRLRLTTSQLDLEPALTRMGMGEAFTDRADLSRIAPGLAVSRVTHDAVMEVDEKGTVAAAVTVVGVEVTSLPPPPEHLVFDRPFLVVIHDDDTGSILFLAKVNEPA